MTKEPTTTLYVRIPESIMKEIRDRAEREQRTLSATTERMLRHVLLCDHKVTITDEL